MRKDSKTVFGGKKPKIYKVQEENRTIDQGAYDLSGIADIV